MPASLMIVESIGRRRRLEPPTTACPASPLRMLCTAWCTATRDEEQAVSTVTEGPRRSKA
ncbi:hypothetical protein NORO109296_18390 [Nocardiopsis rhodophaea]